MTRLAHGDLPRAMFELHYVLYGLDGSALIVGDITRNFSTARSRWSGQGAHICPGA